MNILERLKENPLLVAIGIGLGLLGSMNAAGIFGPIWEQAEFRMLLAEIGTTRAAAAAMPCSTIGIAYQPVVGETLRWNQLIAHEKESRKHWWSRYMAPLAWNDVQPIPMPCPGLRPVPLAPVVREPALIAPPFK